MKMYSLKELAVSVVVLIITASPDAQGKEVLDSIDGGKSNSIGYIAEWSEEEGIAAIKVKNTNDLRPGSILCIRRADCLVGRIRVKSIYEKISFVAGEPLGETFSRRAVVIEVGDRAFLSNPESQQGSNEKDNLNTENEDASGVDRSGRIQLRQEEAYPEPRILGSIVEWSSDLGFAVIQVSNIEEISLGATLLVRRDSKPVGQMKVSSIYKNESSVVADPITHTFSDSINPRVGDTVVMIGARTTATGRDQTHASVPSHNGDHPSLNDNAAEGFQPDLPKSVATKTSFEGQAAEGVVRALFKFVASDFRNRELSPSELVADERHPFRFTFDGSSGFGECSVSWKGEKLTVTGDATLYAEMTMQGHYGDDEGSEPEGGKSKTGWVPVPINQPPKLHLDSGQVTCMGTFSVNGTKVIVLNGEAKFFGKGKPVTFSDGSRISIDGKTFIHRNGIWNPSNQTERSDSDSLDD